MTEFNIVYIDSNTIAKGAQVFSKAMNFSIDQELSVLNDSKLFMAHNNFVGIGLELNGSIHGFAALIGMKSPTAWIPYVGVDPEFQGMGGGKILMDKLLTIAKEHNWHSVELVASHAGFPLYKKCGFRTDYPVSHYEIKSILSKSSKYDLDILEIPKGESIPNWVLQFDRNRLGIDRSNIIPLHLFEKITLISKEQQGYGMIYGQKLGPIVADSIELAREIIIESFELGATSLTLPMTPPLIDFFNQAVTLNQLPNRNGYKMTFGQPISFNKKTIIGLRSMAYG